MNLVYLCIGIFLLNEVSDVAANEDLQNDTFLQPNLTTNLHTNDSAKLNNKPQKWISELMDEAKAVFNVDSANNNKCKTDFQLYKLHLQNLSIWAVRSMFFSLFLLHKNWYCQIRNDVNKIKKCRKHFL